MNVAGHERAKARLEWSARCQLFVTCLCVVLLILTSGCAPTLTPRTRLSPFEARGKFGTTVVTTGEEPAETSFIRPMTSSGAAAGKGALMGLVGVAKGGDPISAAIGVAILPFAVVGGAIYGATAAKDPGEIDRATEVLDRALTEARIQETLRDLVIRRLAERGVEVPDPTSNIPIATVIETHVSKVEFQGSGINPDFSLVVRGNVTVGQDTPKRFFAWSDRREFLVWSANDAQLFREQLVRRLDKLAEMMVDDLLSKPGPERALPPPPPLRRASAASARIALRGGTGPDGTRSTSAAWRGTNPHDPFRHHLGPAKPGFEAPPVGAPARERDEGGVPDLPGPPDPRPVLRRDEHEMLREDRQGLQTIRREGLRDERGLQLVGQDPRDQRAGRAGRQLDAHVGIRPMQPHENGRTVDRLRHPDVVLRVRYRPADVHAGAADRRALGHASRRALARCIAWARAVLAGVGLTLDEHRWQAAAVGRGPKQAGDCFPKRDHPRALAQQLCQRDHRQGDSIAREDIRAVVLHHHHRIPVCPSTCFCATSRWH